MKVLRVLALFDDPMIRGRSQEQDRAQRDAAQAREVDVLGRRRELRESVGEVLARKLGLPL